MRVAVNGGTLRGLGASAVGESIVRALTARGRDDEFIVWIPRRWVADREALPPETTVRVVGDGIVHKLVTDQVRVPVEVRRGKWDVLFSLNDLSTVVCARPHLLLLHQANLVAPDEHLDFPIPPAFRARLTGMKALFAANLRSVDVVTVQTQYMKQGLIDRWGLEEERIAVVPSTVSPDLAGTGAPRRAPAPAPLLVYPSMGYPFKNHVVLADMMSGLSRRGMAIRCALTVRREEVGALVSRARELGVLDAFDFLGRLPLPTVHEVMASATAVVFPSKLESFGLPYVEAMALGVPLIAADRPVAREVCGDGAVYCDANDGDAFAQAVADITSDPDAATALGERGWKRSQAVGRSWSSIAEEYLRILHRLGGG